MAVRLTLNDLLRDSDVDSGETYDRQLLTELVDELKDRWLRPVDAPDPHQQQQQQAPRASVRDWAYDKFGLGQGGDSGDLKRFEDLEDAYKLCLYQALRLYNCCLQLDAVGNEDDQRSEDDFKRIFGAIAACRDCVESEIRMDIISSNISDASPPEIEYYRFSFPDYSKLNQFQNLLIYLLRTLEKHQYRKFGEKAWKQIRTPDGKNTRAWEEVCEITEFIYRECDKETNHEQWLNLTHSKDNADKAKNYLVNSSDLQFQELRPDHKVMSFSDGVYFLETDEFVGYDETDASGNKKLRADICSIKYHDVPFDPSSYEGDCEGWGDIPTPEFETILESQNLDYQTRLWLYVMLGRMLYDVGEKDNWQLMMFLKGVAGCGKSTIAKIMRSLYPSEMVATLSGNIEAQFGLGPIYDKRLVVCSEVKDNFKLNLGDLQSIVTGEEVSCARKNKDPVVTVWKAPLFFCGNEIPRGWIDASNAISRRMLVFDMLFRVTSTNTFLFEDIMKNIGRFVRKINLGYREAIQEYAGVDLWGTKQDGSGETILPEALHTGRKRLKAEIDGLYAFIEDGDMRRAPGAYIPLKKFQQSYMEWRKSANLVSIRWNPDHYEATFSSFNLTVSAKETRLWPADSTDTYRDLRFVDGIDLTENFSMGADDSMI